MEASLTAMVSIRQDDATGSSMNRKEAPDSDDLEESLDSVLFLRETIMTSNSHSYILPPLSMESPKINGAFPSSLDSFSWHGILGGGPSGYDSTEFETDLIKSKPSLDTCEAWWNILHGKRPKLSSSLYSSLNSRSFDYIGGLSGVIGITISRVRPSLIFRNGRILREYDENTLECRSKIILKDTPTHVVSICPPPFKPRKTSERSRPDFSKDARSWNERLADTVLIALAEGQLMLLDLETLKVIGRRTTSHKIENIVEDGNNIVKYSSTQYGSSVLLLEADSRSSWVFWTTLDNMNTIQAWNLETGFKFEKGPGSPSIQNSEEEEDDDYEEITFSERCAFHLDAPRGKVVTALKCHPSRSWLFSAHSDATVRCWDVCTGRLRYVLQDPVVTSDSSLSKLWRKGRRPPTTMEICNYKFGSNNTIKELLFVGFPSGVIYIWDVGSPTKGHLLGRFSCFSKVKAPVMHPTASSVKNSSSENLDTRTIMGPSTDNLSSISMPSWMNLVITITQKGQVKLWELELKNNSVEIKEKESENENNEEIKVIENKLHLRKGLPITSPWMELSNANNYFGYCPSLWINEKTGSILSSISSLDHEKEQFVAESMARSFNTKQKEFGKKKSENELESDSKINKLLLGGFNTLFRKVEKRYRDRTNVGRNDSSLNAEKSINLSSLSNTYSPRRRSGSVISRRASGNIMLRDKAVTKDDYKDIDSNDSFVTVLVNRMDKQISHSEPSHFLRIHSLISPNSLQASFPLVSPFTGPTPDWFTGERTETDQQVPGSFFYIDRGRIMRYSILEKESRELLDAAPPNTLTHQFRPIGFLTSQTQYGLNTFIVRLENLLGNELKHGFIFLQEEEEVISDSNKKRKASEMIFAKDCIFYGNISSIKCIAILIDNNTLEIDSTLNIYSNEDYEIKKKNVENDIKSVFAEQKLDIPDSFRISQDSKGFTSKIKLKEEILRIFHTPRNGGLQLLYLNSSGVLGYSNPRDLSQFDDSIGTFSLMSGERIMNLAWHSESMFALLSNQRIVILDAVTLKPMATCTSPSQYKEPYFHGVLWVEMTLLIITPNHLRYLTLDAKLHTLVSFDMPNAQIAGVFPDRVFLVGSEYPYVSSRFSSISYPNSSIVQYQSISLTEPLIMGWLKAPARLFPDNNKDSFLVKRVINTLERFFDFSQAALSSTLLQELNSRGFSHLAFALSSKYQSIISNRMKREKDYFGSLQEILFPIVEMAVGSGLFSEAYKYVIEELQREKEYFKKKSSSMINLTSSGKWAGINPMRLQGYTMLFHQIGYASFEARNFAVASKCFKVFEDCEGILDMLLLMSSNQAELIDLEIYYLELERSLDSYSVSEKRRLLSELYLDLLAILNSSMSNTVNSEEKLLQQKLAEWSGLINRLKHGKLKISSGGSFNGEEIAWFTPKNEYDYISNPIRLIDRSRMDRDIITESKLIDKSDENEGKEEELETDFVNPQPEEDQVEEPEITKGEDGFYRNSDGQIVDEKGFRLRPDDIAEWVKKQNGEVKIDTEMSKQLEGNNMDDSEEPSGLFVHGKKFVVKIKTLEEIQEDAKKKKPAKASSFMLAAPGSQSLNKRVSAVNSSGFGLVPPPSKFSRGISAPPVTLVERKGQSQSKGETHKIKESKEAKDSNLGQEKEIPKPNPIVSLPKLKLPRSESNLSTNPIFSKYNDDVKHALGLLEKGELVKSYTKFSEVLKKLSEDFPKDFDLQKPALLSRLSTLASSYRKTLRLLIMIRKLEEENGDISKIAILSRMLTDLPMKAVHKRIIYRKAIEKNMNAGGYGISGRLLEQLTRLPNTKQSEKKALDSRLKECRKHGFVDNPQVAPELDCPSCEEKISSGSNICPNCSYKILWDSRSLKLIRNPETLVCTRCTSVMANVAPLTVDSSCSICYAGPLKLENIKDNYVNK